MTENNSENNDNSSSPVANEEEQAPIVENWCGTENLSTTAELESAVGNDEEDNDDLEDVPPLQVEQFYYVADAELIEEHSNQKYRRLNCYGFSVNFKELQEWASERYNIDPNSTEEQIIERMKKGSEGWIILKIL